MAPSTNTDEENVAANGSVHAASRPGFDRSVVQWAQVTPASSAHFGHHRTALGPDGGEVTEARAE